MSNIGGDNSLVTKQVLKKIVDDCKVSFQSAATAFSGDGAGNVLVIELRAGDWSKLFLHLQAYATDGIDTFVQLYSSSASAGKVINIGKGEVIAAYKDANDSGATVIYLECEKGLISGQVTIQAYDTDGQVIYQPIALISTSSDNAGTEWATVETLHLEPTDFSITSASGEDVEYTSGRVFKEVETAGKLSEEKTFTVVYSGAEPSDLSGSEVLVDGSTFVDYINENPQILPIATKTQPGIVQIGEGLDITNGLVSCPGVTQATKTTLGTVKVGHEETSNTRAIQIDSTGNLYMELDGFDIHRFEIMTGAYSAANNIGKIVQYIGPTDDNYTQGYFYKSTAAWALINPYSDDHFTIATTNGATLGSLWATYFAGKTWVDDDSMVISMESGQYGGTLQYTDGTWRWYCGQHYYDLSIEDIENYLGITVARDDAGAPKTDGTWRFTLNVYSAVQTWTRINVQPVSFNSDGAWSEITNEEIDAIINEPLTDIILYDAAGNIIEDSITLSGTAPYTVCTVQGVPWDADASAFSASFSPSLNYYYDENSVVVSTLPTEETTVEIYCNSIVKAFTITV